MSHRSRILVVLPRGGEGRFAPWRRGLPRDRFVVVDAAGIGTTLAKTTRFEAILFQVDGEGRPPAPLKELRRTAAAGTPLLPFRFGAGTLPGSSRRGRKTRVLTLPLAPHPSLLVDLLDREIHLIRLMQRGRSAAQVARGAAERMRALSAIVRLTGNELDPHRVIDVAMEKVTEFLHPSAWSFLLAEPDQGLLTVERTGGEGIGSMKGKRLSIGEGLAGRAAQRRQTVIVEDAGKAVLPDLPKTLSVRSVLAVPLLSRGRLVGVLLAVDRHRARRFTPRHGRLMSLLLEPAAVAIDNALLLKKSQELSVTDDLTKLYNSRYLNATLRREVERSKRYRTPVSLIFLDLDGFKSVNDQHGHLWGSRTLVEIGRVIGATVREIDVVSRFGGDEFTVILPQTGPEGAAIIAERIRQKIAETTFLASYGMSVRITASLGIASFPDHGRSKDDLLARADQAMYLVKGKGKNGVALAETETPRPALLRTVR